MNEEAETQTLASDFELAVLSGAKDRVSQAEPRQLLAELRQEIVGNEAYHSSQDVQDETESRLWIRTGRGEEEEEERRWCGIKNLNMCFLLRSLGDISPSGRHKHRRLT